MRFKSMCSNNVAKSKSVINILVNIVKRILEPRPENY